VKRLISILSLVLFCPLLLRHGALRSPNEAGYRWAIGTPIVRDVDAAKKFWTILGGTPVKIDGEEAMKFPGVFVFMTPGSPSGGSKGSWWITSGSECSIPSSRIASGLPRASRCEDHQESFEREYGGNVYSPDELEVEITQENGAILIRVCREHFDESNHMHFYGAIAIRQQMRDWYVQMFGYSRGARRDLIGDVPA